MSTNDGGVMHDAVMRAWTARAAAGTPEVPQKSTRKFGLTPTQFITFFCDRATCLVTLFRFLKLMPRASQIFNETLVSRKLNVLDYIAEYCLQLSEIHIPTLKC